MPVPANASVVDATTGEVTTAPAALATAVERISALPGGSPDVSRAVIGEIALDMVVFGTKPRLCSWAKILPRTVQSGGNTGKAVTGKGHPYLKAALGQMAMGTAKTDTFLGARYRCLAKRMPKAKTLAALERSILIIIFHLLSDPAATFEDLGADHYEKRVDKHRQPGPPARSPGASRDPHHGGLTKPPHGPPTHSGAHAPHPAWRARPSRLFHGCNVPVRIEIQASLLLLTKYALARQCCGRRALDANRERMSQDNRRQR